MVFLATIQLLLIATTFKVAVVATDVDQITILSGSSLQLSCGSSFAPAWAKVNQSPLEYKTLFNNGRKNPNFKDTRFSFYNKESVYHLKISPVIASDAGNYVCDGDNSKSFLLNVIR